MIAIRAFVRFKDRRAHPYTLGGVNASLSGSRWRIAYAGNGIDGMLQLDHSTELFPVVDFEFSRMPFIINHAYTFGDAKPIAEAETRREYGANEGVVDPFELISPEYGSLFRASGNLRLFHPELIVTPDDVPNRLSDEEAKQFVASHLLCGARIRITRASIGANIRSQTVAELTHGKYIDGYVENAELPVSVLVSGRRISLRNCLDYQIIPDGSLFKKAEPVLIRDFQNHGIPVVPITWIRRCAYSIAEDMDRESTHVKLFDRTDGRFLDIPSHLVRRPSPEEQAFTTAHTAGTPEITDLFLAEHLGETVMSLIERHPTTLVTRGMVFSLTDVQIKSEDDTKEKILARLKANPGRLLEKIPKEHLVIPDDLFEAGEKWWLDSLNLKPATARKKQSPLDALNDDDRVIVELSGQFFEERVVRQSRYVDTEMSIAIPAGVVKQGRGAVRDYINLNCELRARPNREIPAWNDTRTDTQIAMTTPELTTLFFPGFDRYVPKIGPAYVDDGTPF